MLRTMGIFFFLGPLEASIIRSATPATIGYHCPVAEQAKYGYPFPLASVYFSIMPEVALVSMSKSNILPYSIKAANSLPTWRYRYRGALPAFHIYPFTRSNHGEEVFLVFGASPNSNNKEFSPLDSAASTYLRTVWTTFIKNPEKGLLDFGWPLYSPNCK